MTDGLLFLTDSASESFCKWIISGCAVAIVAQAGIIVKMALAYRSEMLERVAQAEKIHDMIAGLHDTKHD